MLLCCLALPIPALAKPALPPLYLPAPDSLPNVTQPMLTADYWIQRHPHPDRLILTPSQIKQFNKLAKQRAGSFSNLLDICTGFSEAAVKRQIEQHITYYRNRRLYNTKGERLSSSYWSALRDSMNLLHTTTHNRMMVGFPIRFADQRAFPVEDTVTSLPYDYPFNEFQTSGYDTATPLVLYFYSKNGRWVYGASSSTIGWFRTRDIAVFPLKEWKSYVQMNKRITITSAYAKVWTKPDRQIMLDSLRMGCSLPFIIDKNGYYYTLIPRKDRQGQAYMTFACISQQDAVVGNLPYTVENVYRQAFKLLGQRYGWADTGGYWDCSSLLKQLYTVFGINLPRNGKNQVLSGSSLHTLHPGDSDSARRQALSQKAEPALTLLRLDGHIMLYLGNSGGIHYALHDTWGYRQPYATEDDPVYTIGKTVVSDLSLGEKSYKGSLLKRITHFSQMR